MKKILITSIALFLALAFSSQAFAQSFGIGAGVTYFAVNDSTFKEVYPGSNMMISASLGANLSKKFELRAEFNYFTAKGEMTLSKEKVTYTFTPIVAGLRFRMFNSKSISPYVGAGIDFCSYKEKVPERFGGDVTGSKTGFHGELGAYVKLSKAFLLDINFRYLSAKAEPFEGVERELGGFRAGIGFEYRF